MISCDCSYECEVGSDVYQSTTRTARKKHKCCECGEVILPGDKYEDVSGLCDGDWFRAKTCIPCVRIRTNYCPHGFSHGELREQIFECLNFYYDEEPGEIEIKPEEEERHREWYLKQLSKTM